MASPQAAAVRYFLETHRGEAWCDRCIQKEIGYDAQTTTKSLGQNPGYRVTRGVCADCKKTKKTAVYDP